MGKKKQEEVRYDRNALVDFGRDLQSFRRPAQGGKIPDLKIDIEGLEGLVKELPKKEREPAEKFWGLIPGTTAYKSHLAKNRKPVTVPQVPFLAPLSMGSKLPIPGNPIGMGMPKRYEPEAPKKLDVASLKMLDSVNEIKNKFYTLESLYRYDRTVHELIDNIARKINKTGSEDVSDLEAVKYLLILVVFIAGGPRLVFERLDSVINLKEEEDKHFDEYATLEAIWDETTHLLPDHSIRLRLLMNAIEMFDRKDVVAMKRYARLPIDPDERSMETIPLRSVKSCRLFKEHLFPDGPWDVTTILIYGEPKKRPIGMKKFMEHFGQFSRDWNAVEKYRKEEPGTIWTSQGEKKVPVYEIGGRTFTDVYEIMFLYLNRNLL